MRHQLICDKATLLFWCLLWVRKELIRISISSLESKPRPTSEPVSLCKANYYSFKATNGSLDEPNPKGGHKERVQKEEEESSWSALFSSNSLLYKFHWVLPQVLTRFRPRHHFIAKTSPLLDRAEALREFFSHLEDSTTDSDGGEEVGPNQPYAASTRQVI